MRKKRLEMRQKRLEQESQNQNSLVESTSSLDNGPMILETRHYDPFGNVYETTGSRQTDYGFTGEWTDEMGLIHLRARDYNPNLGVFINPDPMQGYIQEPMTLNPYSYVRGNPVNLIDPSGMYGEQPGDYANVCGVSGQNPTCTVNTNPTIAGMMKTLSHYQIKVANICDWEAWTPWGGNTNLAQNATIAINETFEAVRDAANRLGNFYHAVPYSIFTQFMPGPITLVIDNSISPDRMMVSNPNGRISINYDSIPCIVATPPGRCFYNVLIHELGHMVDFAATLRLGINPMPSQNVSDGKSVLGSLARGISLNFGFDNLRTRLGFYSASMVDDIYPNAELVADIIGNWFAGTIQSPDMEQLAEELIHFARFTDSQVLQEILEILRNLPEVANGMP